MAVYLRDYLILEKLAEGGFGEVFLALQERSLSNRVIVLKTIKEKFAEDEDFKKSFLDEIKVSFPLTHPNIAQIYEYGEIDGQIFYALEYIEGFSLRQLITKGDGRRLSIPIILHTLIEVAKGLHFAHTHINHLTGQSLNIIHRDVSPHNIMISFEARVKVIDFGTAKAKSNYNETRKGVLKGKPSYMAPEYVSEGYYDHRFDQFSLGVILWELLTGKKLFKGKNHFETLDKIKKCNVPNPSIFNDRIDPELDEIVLKMLNKNFRKRYRNLEIAHNAMESHLIRKYPDFTSSDFRKFIRAIYSNEIVRHSMKIKRLIAKSLLARKKGNGAA